MKSTTTPAAKSNKATHNGTCQCCGNSQAVNPTLSLHGYTVDFGYFSGTCLGARKAPLEEKRDLCDKIIADLRKQGADLLAKTPADIKTVKLTVRIKMDGDFRTVDVLVGSQDEIDEVCKNHEHAKAFTAEYQGYRKQYSGNNFAEMVERMVGMMHRKAKHMIDHAKMMEELADKVHGKDLEPRATEVVKVRFDIPCRNRDKAGAAAGFKRAKEMKESGLYSRVTVRRPNMYSFAHTCIATPK